MRFQQAPYRIADVVALLFILHGNTSFGSLAPIIPYRSCKHYLGHVDISTTEVYARIDAEMKRKVFEEKVPNFTPNTTMPWEEDKDLLQWLTQFGKKSF